MTIMSTIYKNKYYEDFSNNMIDKFKNYFIESLKYEIFDCDKQKDFLIKDFMTFDDKAYIVTSKGANTVYFKRDSDRDNILINIGYDDEYKVNGNIIERTFDFFI